MPGQTPIFGFQYPCPGETVGPGSFSFLANQIDAKLLELESDYDLMLNRKNITTDFSPSQNIPAGVDTVLTSPVVTWTIPMSGVWIVHAEGNPSSNGNVNMQRLRVRLNAVVQFGQTQNTEGNSILFNNAVGPVVASAGDVITLQWLFNGTVTQDVIARIDAKMLVRIYD